MRVKHRKKESGSRVTIDGRVFNCKIVKPKKRGSYAVCSSPVPARQKRSQRRTRTKHQLDGV